LVFVGSFWFVKNLKKEFVPSQDQSLFMVRLQSPIGSSIDYTDQLVKEAEQKLSQIPEVSRYFVSIGGMGGGGVNTAMAFVTLKAPEDRKKTQQEVMAVARKQLTDIKDLKVVIQDTSVRGFGGGRGFPIEFSLRGPDWKKLVEISQDIQKKMESDKQFQDVDSNYDSGRPEIKIIPNRDRAAQLGVSVEDLGRSISTSIGGTRVGRFTEDGRRIDVRLRLEEQDRLNPNDILDIRVRNNRGELVRVGEIAELESTKALVSITRQQRERAINIYSNIAPGESQQKLLDTIDDYSKALPPGYRIIKSGSSASFAESFGGLTFALWLGVVVAYMILASQFNSFIHPITVLLSLPFSLTGAWAALWLGNASLNLYSMIGLILLMGIVKKNAIMLVDFANQRRKDGLSVNEAMIDAGPIRLRPILMTSITMISASLPSILALGPGSETRAPMSLAVIGGVIVSTVFTLFVIPAAYSLLAKFESGRPQQG
jgi:HAE1 family hydrophobic/amphiphilic exporter-1